MFFTVDVNAAYIDPSVMTYAIQAVAGVVVALSAFLGVYFSRFKKWFHIGSDKNYETNELIFNDYRNNKEIVKDSYYENEETNLKKRRKPWITGIFISFAISFMCFFYEPLFIFFTNTEQFRYDFFDIIGYLAILFLVIVALLSLVYLGIYKLNKKLYNVCLWLGFSLFVAMWIQGTMLIEDLPPTIGDPIDWSLYSRQFTQSSIVFLTSFIGFFLIWMRIKKTKFHLLVNCVCSLISVVLGITLIYVGISHNGFQRKIGNFRTYNELNLVSSDRNFIILVVDQIDSQTFNNLLETSNPEYSEWFEDFTYYPDTLCAYPYTSTSLPFILSGEWFENNQDFASFSTQCLKNSKLFAELFNRNYRCSLYDTEFILNDNYILNFSNIIRRSSGIENPVKFMMDEMRLAFYMFMPYQLKKYEPYVMYNLITVRSSQEFNWENRWFYDFFDEHPMEITDKPRFMYIHTCGAHSPLQYDEFLNDIPMSEATYEGGVQGTMTMVHKYLELLKNAGVYDNSAIVVLADHGSNAEKGEDEQFGRQNAFLMVKGINEDHSFKISNKPISFVDLMPAYKNMLNEKKNDDIFSMVGENQSRTRRFLFHYYWLEELVEYELTDDVAWNTEALKATGRTYKRQD